MPRSKFGTPHARLGQVKIQYGYSAHDGEDLFMCYGGHDGSRADSRLIMSALNSKNYSLLNKTFEKSLIEELEVRGYDIKTLVFTIEKQGDR